MLKRHKDFLRSLVTELRHTLAGSSTARGDLDLELERLGVAPDGSTLPLDALPNPTLAERRARHVADAQLAALPPKERATARAELVERAAYSWINRLLALRAMEARELIEETLRANQDYDSISEALFVLRSSAPARTTGPDKGWWAVIEDACATQAAALPGLFDPADPAVALCPSAHALLRCVTLIGGGLPGYTPAEQDAAFADPDAIGWAYQFYQAEAKEQIYTKLGKGGKVSTRAEIAAATQLFTEPYMVQWLLQNSLGRSYHEAYPDSNLPATWAYYITPEKREPAAPGGLAGLTLLDPCMGSGHFLRAAFDMFAAIYREQYPAWTATQIADAILTHHLHGIDIDPRAAQLTALTLYLRAWEGVRDERRARRHPGAGQYRPPTMNLATTPSGLTTGALDRHLRRHPEDAMFRPLLEGIFAALEQATILGSLLHPGEHLDQAIADFQKPRTMQMDFDPDEMALRRSLHDLARTDPAELRRVLFERVARSFAAEAGDTDVAAALFGREAEQGVRLLQLLDHRYAVVVTNPPYMGSKNMDAPLKRYVEHHYLSGKRDLYAAFILRCLELCQPGGRVAMVTQQSWMFLGSFADLRAVPEERILDVRKKGGFLGLLRETAIESLAHLGEYAFEEVSAAGAFAALFIIQKQAPIRQHQMMTLRLVGLKSPEEKATVLEKVKYTQSNKILTLPKQIDFIAIPDSPVVYYLGPGILALLTQSQRLRDVAEIKQGLATADDNRFLRYTWEILTTSNRWPTFTKGGGYSKWFGLNWYHTDWEHNGARLTVFERSVIRNPTSYFCSGWSYSLICRGSLSLRHFDIPGVIGHKGPGIYTESYAVPALAQSHVISFVLRAISPQLAFEINTVSLTPLPAITDESFLKLSKVAERIKRSLVSLNPIERTYTGFSSELMGQGLASILHTVEGQIEQKVCRVYNLTESTIQTVIEDTGTPAGWFPLIGSYDTLPDLPPDLDLPPLPQEVYDYLAAHERIQPDARELARIKANLRALYEAGPGAKDVEHEEAEGEEDDAGAEEAGTGSGARIPIPTETFLEELSVKLETHPISVYWLLEELRAAGARCRPEEQRLLEDRLSILVLRLLGHLWPRQIEAGEPVPPWANADGIIPLTAGTGEPALAERVRTRLRTEDGDLGAQRTEELLRELTGLGLDEWLRSRFFPRHVRQFKYRPIAWHLASTPTPGGKRKSSGRRAPAFECLLYYHACGGDVLARLRTGYVEPLLRAERARVEEARRANDDTAAALATERAHELETFADRLRAVADEGFACAELDTLLAQEPLDRWSGDGYLPPTSASALAQAERAWHVDLNDGVRVNIAPLQLEGLLAADVLKASDAKKAIADRARWRADERRWVRAGKLPRPGWVDPAVPESPAWTTLAPQRAAEAAKLAAKRAATKS